MNNRQFVEENKAARLELGELIDRLDERSFECAVGSRWTVSTVLCHLAFWDQRAIYLLREWQRGGFEPSVLSDLTTDSINEGVNAVSQSVPDPAAARLAIESAEAVDALLTEISDELVSRIVSSGSERFLMRSLHRREHLRKIKQALAA